MEKMQKDVSNKGINFKMAVKMETAKLRLKECCLEQWLSNVQEEHKNFVIKI